MKNSIYNNLFRLFLVDSRPRSANKSPLNRPTSAAYYRPRSAARPSSVGSSRPSSTSMRPNTDPSKSDLLGYILCFYFSKAIPSSFFIRL